MSKQQAAWILCPAREAFYGGAAGGGKSVALLMAALQYVDTPGYAALILRRNFPQLNQPGMLIPLSRAWLAKTDAKWNAQEKQWTFPSGAVLKFGHVDDEQSIYNYQGGAYQFVGFDELTQFTEFAYTYIAFSRQRRDVAMREAGIPIRVRATANPGGVGHSWVKSRFIDNREPGTVFIPAKVADNPGLDVADYAKSMSHLGEILRAQLLEGDWGAFEGAAYPTFKPETHVVDAFDVPDAWERYESMDWGSTNATAWLAHAVDHDGNIVIFDELYATEPANRTPDDVAPLLRDRRSWWHPHGAHIVCHADPSVFDNKGVMNRWGTPANVADEFDHLGIKLHPANRDRVAGYVRIAALLRIDPARAFPDWHERAGELGSPRCFIFRRCTNLIEQLQGAPLEGIGEPHPGEAVSRKWEGPYGHAHASFRYGVLSWASPSAVPEVPVDDLRLAAAQRMLAKAQRDDYQYI